MSKEIATKDLKEMIFVIRGQRVMIDADLARLYGVSTKVLNQAVKRNSKRFPEGFMLKLNQKEKEELYSSYERFNNLRFSKTPPLAFSEHGSIMLANILKSSTAIEVSIEVVKAFVELREFLNTNKEFARKFEAIEKRFADHDQNFIAVFEALRQIMNPPVSSKRPIGFGSNKVEK